MNKLINNPADVVREMLEGLVSLNPNQTVLDPENVVIRSDLNKSEVAIISGGGSGHEPAHAGYVGKGMLHAAVAGEVFTSPSVDTVLTAIRATAGNKGALLIVKNYTGDRINFGLAAELARKEGIPIAQVVVADDVALRDMVATEHSRGIAGTILVHKIAGAVAATGADLESIKRAAKDAIDNIATMGVASGSCTIPVVGKPNFNLPSGWVELGLGIHGEKGIERIVQKTADELVDILLLKILQNLEVKKNNPVALLVNGLGGATQMELAIIARHAVKRLRERKIDVQRAWSGNFMTALEMPGFSLSLMRLNDERLANLDYPVNVPAWFGGGKIIKAHSIPVVRACTSATNNTHFDFKPNAFLKKIMLNIANELEKSEPLLTELDSKAGDGDLGMNMCRVASTIKSLPNHAWVSGVTMLNSVGESLRKAIGGSFGSFCAVGLLRAARHLATQSHMTNQALADAFTVAVGAIAELGGAKLNDRTMLDALYPAEKAFNLAIRQGLSLTAALKMSVQAAEDGAKNTAQMLPKLGRASYLGERARGIQDAGAVTVVICLKALFSVMPDCM